jgi:hypothetical protein
MPALEPLIRAASGCMPGRFHAALYAGPTRVTRT